MKYMRKEPYKIIAWGWVYAALMVFLLSMMLSIMVGSYQRGAPLAFTVSAATALTILLGWRRQFSHAIRMTNRKLEERRQYIQTVIIPQFGVAAEGQHITLSTIYNLLDNRDATFVHTFGTPDFQYGDLRRTVYRKVKNGEIATEYRFTSILELRLPRELPNMLFDSRMNNKRFRYLVDKDQLDHLEGGFDDVFLTYFPMHYEIDARSIIAPDVMAPMLDAQQFDMEIVGDKLYLFGAMVADADIATMIRQGLRIRDALADHVPAYRDERLGDATNRTEVAMLGKNLQESMTPYLLSVVGLVAVEIYLIYTTAARGAIDVSDIVSFGLFGILILLPLWSCVSIVKAKKRKEKLYEAYLQNKPTRTNGT